MDSRARFHEIFLRFNYPSFVKEEYIYDLFERCLFTLSSRIEKEFNASIPNPHLMLSYIVGEYVFLMEPLNEENRNKLLNDEQLKKHLVQSITDKIIFNEYIHVNSDALISKYNPTISNMRFFLNFMFERINSLKNDSDFERLIVDIIKRALLSIKGALALLVEGLETEAFATWRTVHETECILKILYEHPNIIDTYKHHIEFSLAFRDEYKDKDLQQCLIDEVKSYLKEHNLKSKDLKKYIEYGWLYAIKNVEEDFENFKLNFRNGVQNVAKLSEYSSTYEMSSEIAHASPLLIFSNKKFFLHRCLIALYESFLRVENIFNDLLNKIKKEESTAYFSMRSSYIEELEIILAKEKLDFAALFNN